MDNVPIKTICYKKLHFNEQLISWINSRIKFRKIGIQGILMKPQYCPFLKCFPINFQLRVDKCFVVVIKNHLLTAGRGC